MYSAIGMNENALNDELDQLINKEIDMVSLENDKLEQMMES
ncbi:hypothetical protein MHB50_20695 [Siminovitchia sp. FSL H7-0308]|uniref:Uncharacterized protein n=1 Tax=Siminovitchia thermophila TaxID=1245522 RepID=A0ABS2R4L0_9BACI|nr:hypothetical protein [Siminovitchia thermophila]MBM7714595.1 hypothetical protein [Siminovitchia thermophila]